MFMNIHTGLWPLQLRQIRLEPIGGEALISFLLGQGHSLQVLLGPQFWA